MTLKDIETAAEQAITLETDLDTVSIKVDSSRFIVKLVSLYDGDDIHHYIELRTNSEGFDNYKSYINGLDRIKQSTNLNIMRLPVKIVDDFDDINISRTPKTVNVGKIFISSDIPGTISVRNINIEIVS